MEILEAIQREGRAKRTRILRRANLSHDRMTKYLEELVKKNLVREEQTNNGKNKYYFLSDRGVRFLDKMREKERLVSVLGLSL